MQVTPNGNRAARRSAGQRQARPHSDLTLTRVAGSVFLGLTGAGFVRLTPGEARQVATELAELATTAQGELS
jgi:hypothetical protein